MDTPSVKKNLILSSCYQVLNVIAPFITAPYVSRVLGADGIGVYSFTSSVVSYFALFAVLGTMSYGAREIARVRDDIRIVSKTFWEIELLSVITSSVSTIAWVLFALSAPQYNTIYLILAFTLLSSMTDISWLFSGLELFSKLVLRNTIVKIIGIISIFLFVEEKNDLILYIALMTITTFLGSVSLWLYLPKMLVRVSVKDLKVLRHFRKTLVYFLPSIATTIYTVLDKTLIGVITQSEYENGYYEQATKIVNIAKAVAFSSINVVLASRTAYLYAQDRFVEIKERILKSLDYCFFVGFGLTCGIIGCADRFVPCFFGEGFEPTIILLQMLSPIMIVISISNILGTHYYAAVGEKYVKMATTLMIIGAMINLILNIILIPRYNALGAVISSLIAEVIISILFVVYGDGFLTINMIITKGWKKILAGTVMIIMMLIISNGVDNNVVALLSSSFMGMIVYIFILSLLKDSFFNYVLDEIVLPKLKSLFCKK